MKEKSGGKQCGKCAKFFESTIDFMDHLNVHIGYKPYMCPQCGVLFSQCIEYMNHIKTYPVFHYFPCTSCHKTLHSEDELSIHVCAPGNNGLISWKEGKEKLYIKPHKDILMINNNEQFVEIKCNNLKTCVQENKPGNDISDQPEITQISKIKDLHLKSTNCERIQTVTLKKDRYKCCLCPKNYDTWNKLKFHRRSHFNKSIFTCRMCQKKFRYSKLLIQHLKSHQVKKKRLLASKHLEKYNSKSLGTQNFNCIHCNKGYMTREKLNNHECFISSNGEPFLCSCFKKFIKASDFKKHIGERPYNCCNCDMQFNTLSNLIRHIRTHTKQKPFICKNCGRGFSQSTNLKNHESVHLGISAITCDKCNFSCKTQNGLVKHKKKHDEGHIPNHLHFDARKTSTGNSRCPVCSKEFPFKRNLGMHMKVHTRKECLCPECGKMFETRGRLSMHYRACHGVPSICKVCGKNFASVVLLSAHEKIHVVEKQYSCDVCFKTFSVKNYLVQHIKTHNVGKQYSCARCGKLFKVAASLKYHSKICL